MIGRVIDGIVAKTIVVDASAVIVMDLKERPKLVHGSFGNLASKESMDRFFSGAFVLSPYFSALSEGRLCPFGFVDSYPVDPAFHRMTGNKPLFPHISLDPGSLSDEVCYAAASGGRAAILLLMRGPESGRFDEDERARLSARSEQIVDLLDHILVLHDEKGSKRSDDIMSEGRVRGRAPSAPGAGPSDAEADSMHFIESYFSETLSPREKSSIALTLEGKSIHGVADTLGISPHTVRVHLRNAYGKLRVRNRLELVGMFVKRAGFRSHDTPDQD